LPYRKAKVFTISISILQLDLVIKNIRKPSALQPNGHSFRFSVNITFSPCNSCTWGSTIPYSGFRSNVALIHSANMQCRSDQLFNCLKFGQRKARLITATQHQVPLEEGYGIKTKHIYFDL
jgi:hypothetical protein